MPSIGLAIIAKNEQQKLPDLLRSIEGAFDQVVLVDTGSRDRTVQLFRGWAKTQEGLRITVERYKWDKDFGAARAFAHSFLDTDWEVWADCDDVITGAQNLRAIAAQAPEQVAGLVCGYNYAQHPSTGGCICYLKRERLVRRGKGKWVNRVHEAQVVDGPVQEIESHIVEWVHQKQAKSVEEMREEDARRNLDILEKWNADEPGNTRTLAYLGTEHAAHGEIDIAIRFFNEYFNHDPEWDEEAAQVYRKLGTALIQKGALDTALGIAFEGIKRLPQWTDSYLTLAEVYHLQGDHAKAIEWAQEALRRGQPQTLLIINPLDYTYAPRKVLAGSLAAVGRLDDAIKIGTEAWHMNPMDEALAQALNEWRTGAKREHTANTICMMTQQLIAHDEQLKAMALIEECVPHFVVDHPNVVQLRSMLRERIGWIHNPRSLLDHYENGGSKPEDFLPDDKLDEVASRLPRTRFLYAGIHEQLIEARHQSAMDKAFDEQSGAFLEAMSNGSA